MKYWILVAVFSFAGYITNAQITAADKKFLAQKQDSLKGHAWQIIRGRNSGDRFLADSNFTRILVRALRTKNSFQFPFDSLFTVSRLYAPDSSFRIFTWQMLINENIVRQHGAIQMRTADGSLKLFPLIDRSDLTSNPADTIASNAAWMGAVYYKVIKKQYNNRNFYTLLGFDENNIRSDKKIMDVLEFVDGAPLFGNKLFVMENKGVYAKQPARFVLEFKKEAATRLTYDEDMDAVVFDELVSEVGEPNKKWTLVPDGEFEGFKWINGKWVHRKQIFDGPAPIKYIAPKPIRDANGTVDETQLLTPRALQSPPVQYPE